MPPLLYPPDATRFGQAGGLPYPAETGRGWQLSDQSGGGCGPQDTHGKCRFIFVGVACFIAHLMLRTVTIIIMSCVSE